jgi:REP element-mobilizing transposase RayT
VPYLITFTCYGSRLPGDPRGSFDHVRGDGERRWIEPSPGLETYHRRNMKRAPYLLSTPESRSLVLRAIANVCSFREWFLYALHVRTNHVHGVVEANVSSRQILHDWKAYATRLLRSAGEEPARILWTHGGSARRIAKDEDLLGAMDYVLRRQGQPMEIYCADSHSARGSTD